MELQNKISIILIFTCLLTVHCQEKARFLEPEDVRVESENFSINPCVDLIPDTVHSDFINLDGTTWDHKERTHNGYIMAVSFNELGNDTIKILPSFLIDNAILEIPCSYVWWFHGIEHERILLMGGIGDILIDTTGDKIIFYLCKRGSSFNLGGQSISINHHSAISFDKSLFFN